MDRDIEDRITSHLAEATDEYIQQGLSRAMPVTIRAARSTRTATRRSCAGAS
jgi:hypothetical protein